MAALRGVNLGGWLIIEKWMTPTLFEGTPAIDEYTFMQQPAARELLRQHQKNFIREEDFAWMAANGVQVVRIPVGYWIFEGDPPYVSCIGRLDWAFAMAKKYHIKVLISMHGAPGSQNGQDHSGRVGKAAWYKSAAHREHTIVVLEQLARRYRDHPEFWGLQLLNEPRAKLVQYRLRRFYNQAYRRVVAIVHPTTRIIFHDAFMPRMMSGAVWDMKRFPATMDIHWYHFAFWAHRWLPLKWYFRLIIPWHGRLITSLKRWQGVIIGEWNGIISGQMLGRYQQPQHAAIVAEHIQRQLAAYEAADAWFYWSYKTERRGVWHFRSMVEDGVIRYTNINEHDF
ncbi:MAG: hypothetical protein WAQ25_00180 [Candidatus Saccharimonas sp.]